MKDEKSILISQESLPEFSWILKQFWRKMI